MNYYENYWALVSSRKQLNRTKSKNAYYEAHHILPKSIYPEYKKLPENIVLLTPREHFIAHFLLTKIYPKGSQEYNKMVYALHKFTIGMKEQKKVVSSREYEKVRLLFIEVLHNREVSDETRQKLSNSLKGKLLGRKIKEETKKKLSESVKKTMTPEHRKLLSDLNKGQKLTKEQKEKQIAGQIKRHAEHPYSDETLKRIKRSNQLNPAFSKKIKCVETGEEFVSISELGRILNIPRRKVSILIKNNQPLNNKHYYITEDNFTK